MSSQVSVQAPGLSLNIGSGNLRLPGFIGVDQGPSPAVDRVVDLTSHPWPFADGSASRVVAWHVLEHLPGYELGKAMDEIHRILQPGGELYARVPYKEPGPYNPCHFHRFNRRTFNFWIDVEATSLQHRGGKFRRLRQEVVGIGGFPVYHLLRHARWTRRLLFHEDVRTPFTRLPSRYRELREWLVRL
ncbi:MAG TPA: methyltransferase domain-containing protein [Thermoplasmata archaeon]|nr:methyltransferase domain-containing protein [Thermoplasmata archaeon]